MKTYTCDFCGKETKRIALKLWKASRMHSKVSHNDYTHHADIGECCVMKVNGIRWQERTRGKHRQDANGRLARDIALGGAKDAN